MRNSTVDSSLFSSNNKTHLGLLVDVVVVNVVVNVVVVLVVVVVAGVVVVVVVRGWAFSSM